MCALVTLGITVVNNQYFYPIIYNKLLKKQALWTGILYTFTLNWGLDELSNMLLKIPLILKLTTNTMFTTCQTYYICTVFTIYIFYLTTFAFIGAISLTPANISSYK